MSSGTAGNGTAGNGTAIKVAEDLVEKPSEKIKSVLVMCAIIFVFAVIFFTFLRKKNRKVFAPRLLLLGTETTIKEGLFSWVTAAFTTKDEDIFMPVSYTHLTLPTIYSV